MALGLKDVEYYKVTGNYAFCSTHLHQKENKAQASLNVTRNKQLLEEGDETHCLELPEDSESTFSLYSDE